MKTKTFVWTLAAALLAGGVMFGVARAAEAARGPWARGQWLQRAAEKLGLTDEQRAAIRDVYAAEKDTLKDLLTRLHEARKALRETIHAQDATDASVRAAAARVASVEAELAVERHKLYQRIHPILTPEQREKIAQWEARMDEWIGRVLERIGERRGE